VGEVFQFVDPLVSRMKFAREVENFRKMEREYIERGWWLVRSEWPNVTVIMGVRQLRPPAVLCGVTLDFTNFDYWPPSVRLVDPFTLVPYKKKELPTELPRRVQAQLPEGVVLPPGLLPMISQPLMQAFGEEEIPFLCLRGTREYHQNPGHTGDTWFLHRRLRAPGSLYSILNVIYTYGVQPLLSYNLNFSVGFNGGQAPE
jgi:hypothetical protein